VNREELISAIFANMQTAKKDMFSHLREVTTPNTSPAQLQLLFLIKQLQPVNAKQLAQKLEMTPGAISQLVEGLHDQGMITRQPHPSDRRVHTLQLSAKAEDALIAVTTRRREVMENVMQGLTTEELQTWLHVQQKLVEALRSKPTEGETNV